MPCFRPTAHFQKAQNDTVPTDFRSKSHPFREIRNTHRIQKPQERGRSVKKRRREMLHTRISPPKPRFLCGKKFPSLLKEIFFLPQSGGNISAKPGIFVLKTEKAQAQDALPAPEDTSRTTKTQCHFVTFSPSGHAAFRSLCAERPPLPVKMQVLSWKTFHPAFPHQRNTPVFPASLPSGPEYAILTASA